MADFATADDVRKRRGVAALTAEQTEQANWLLAVVRGLIAEAIGKNDEWADDLDESDVPTMAKVVTVEVVSRAMTNPDSVKRLQKSLGSFSYSQDFYDTAAGGGLFLTDLERTLVRGAFKVRRSGTAHMASVVTEVDLRPPLPIGYDET